MTAGPYAWVARELAESPFASIRYVEETDSTNADAAFLLTDEHSGGLTIIAEYQRHGAGRKGRAWHAVPHAALLFSTILPRAIAAEQLWLVPFWAALAMRSALLECGVATVLQWPNDLLLRGRKVAGILCQSCVTGELARVACGIGVNVRHLADADAGIAPPPAFCDDVAAVDRAALLLCVLREYERSLPTLDEPDRVTSAWDAAAELPGRSYRIQPDSDAPPFDGVAVGLALGGGLQVVRDNGERETISLADARIVR